MFSMKRITCTSVAALALLVGGATMAPAASAMTPRSSCGIADGGILCLTRSDAGYQAKFQNTSANLKRLHFYLSCKSYTPGQKPLFYSDNGPFYSVPNRVNTFFFQRSALRSSYVCQLTLVDVNSGNEYRTSFL